MALALEGSLSITAALKAAADGGLGANLKLASDLKSATRMAFFRHTGAGSLYLDFASGTLRKGASTGAMAAVTLTEQGAGLTWTKVTGLIILVGKGDSGTPSGYATFNNKARWGASSAGAQLNLGDWESMRWTTGITVAALASAPMQIDHISAVNLATRVLLFGN